MPLWSKSWHRQPTIRARISASDRTSWNLAVCSKQSQNPFILNIEHFIHLTPVYFKHFFVFSLTSPQSNGKEMNGIYVTLSHCSFKRTPQTDSNRITSALLLCSLLSGELRYLLITPHISCMYCYLQGVMKPEHQRQAKMFRCCLTCSPAVMNILTAVGRLHIHPHFWSLQTDRTINMIVSTQISLLWSVVFTLLMLWLNHLYSAKSAETFSD